MDSKKRRYSLEKPRRFRISARLDEFEKEKIEAYCRSNQISEADLLRIRLADLISA